MRISTVLCVCATVAFVVSCGPGQAGPPARPSAVRPRTLLFSPEGVEYTDPSVKLRTKMRSLNQAHRRAAVESLLDIISKPGGYSRLVAADVLLGDEQYWVLSPRGARIVAESVIRVADPLYQQTVPEFWMTRGGEFAHAVYYLIEPKCVVRVNGRDVVLANGLPEGWRAEQGVVELDGQVVAKRRGYPREQFGNTPHEYVVLASYLDEDELRGVHTVVSKLVVRAPDGSRVPLMRKLEFRVEPTSIAD